MRTIASMFLICFYFAATAQQPCVTTAYIAEKNANKIIDAPVYKTLQQLNKPVPSLLTGTPGNKATQSKSTIIQIPVVVHLLYNTIAQNITDVQIKSGLEALNRDFRRQNKDTSNTPERFKSIAADVEIEFQLAAVDPTGRATTGIVRKQTAVPAFSMDDKIKFSAFGGDDAWDSESYLNIWLGNTRRLLGYATMPGGDMAVDGLVINITAFGTINTPAPYHLGRTAVHETGHWLGLRHLWGDDACGDDFVDDTPKQGGYTSGCPTGFRSSCANGNMGDMFMNYMDFTNDACMNLFTKGQKERMRSLFKEGGLRHSFLASNGLGEPWVETIPIQKEDTATQTTRFIIFPNPAIQSITLQVETGIEAEINGTLRLIQANGLPLENIKINSRTQKLQLAHLKPGIYFLQGIINNKTFNQKLIKL